MNVTALPAGDPLLVLIDATTHLLFGTLYLPQSFESVTRRGWIKQGIQERLAVSISQFECLGELGFFSLGRVRGDDLLDEGF